MRRGSVSWRGLIAVAVVAAVLLSGACTSDGDNRGSTPPARPAPGQPAPAQPVRFDPDPRITQDLWPRDASELPVMASRLPATLDPRDSVGAPSILDEPLPRVLAAVQLGIFGRDANTGGLRAGEIALLGLRGQWRSLPLADLGYEGRVYGEVHYALTRSGERLAVSDRRSVFILNVATGAFHRWTVPAREPIVLTWSYDGTRLLLADRYAPSNVKSTNGWELRVSDGAVEEASFGGWQSTIGPDGSTLEVAPSQSGRRAARFSIVEQGQLRTTDLRVPLDEAASPAWHRDVAIGQYSRRLNGAWADQGVGVFDVDSGTMVGFLPLRVRGMWPDVVGWIDEDRLVVGDGAAGPIVSWSPRERELRLLTEFEAHGTYASFALDLL